MKRQRRMTRILNVLGREEKTSHISAMCSHDRTEQTARARRNEELKKEGEDFFDSLTVNVLLTPVSSAAAAAAAADAAAADAAAAAVALVAISAGGSGSSSGVVNGQSSCCCCYCCYAR